jgi:hypothetical protein
MTQHLTKNKIACITVLNNCINTSTQFIFLLSDMPPHRGISVDVENIDRMVALFCVRRLVSSNWQNHEDVYFAPKDKQE